ncbi:CinA family protein [Allosphingosinicella flava]|uniref:CinA family protein n=1 Tax=Allosphingosinicella flava TaxID=2771430 RepID=A0A7T2GLX6_9SPHN|nr:CinA family protein [Sphingosinicella flava]
MVSDAETLSPALPTELEKQTCLLLERACEAGVTLATAESCTGGLLASLLTDVPGVAHAFERGFVTYTDEAKADMLGVPKEMLESEGAVSKPVAIAMAEGALRNSNADIAVSITGFADSGDEPGLVHFASARTSQPTIHREAHFGPRGRGATRVESLRVAVEMMLERL